MPGSIAHFEYVAALLPPEIKGRDQMQVRSQLSAWVAENFIVESFAHVIRRHAHYPLPLSEGESVVDSRFFTTRQRPKMVFMGKVLLQQGNNDALFLSGQSAPELNDSDYYYDLYFPLAPDLTLLQRPNRSLRATYCDLSADKPRQYYYSHADLHVQEQDPGVFTDAAQRAAADIARLLRYENGEQINI